MTTSRRGRELAAQAASQTPVALAATNECGRAQEGSDAAQGTAPGPQPSQLDSVPIDDFVKDLEQDPEWKDAIDDARTQTHGG